MEELSPHLLSDGNIKAINLLESAAEMYKLKVKSAAVIIFSLIERLCNTAQGWKKRNTTIQEQIHLLCL